MNMVRGPKDMWYVQDRNGYMHVLNQETGEHKMLYNFHKDSIQAVTASPKQNYCITLGVDGMVKCWDYARKEVAYEKRFDGGGMVLEHMELSDVSKGRVCAAGFATGVVRILSMTVDGIVILKSFKAHDAAITCLAYSDDLRMFATASAEGDVFFFECEGTGNMQKYEPLCTVRLADARINAARWEPDDKSIVFACDNGRLYKVRRPEPEEIDNKESYYWDNADVKEWCIKIMEFQMAKNQKKDPEEEEKKRRMRLRGELPPEEDEPEEVWEPQPLTTMTPYPTEDGKPRYLVATAGGAQDKFAGYLYVCDFDAERPVEAIKNATDVSITHMSVSKNRGGEAIIIGYANGEVQLVVNRVWDRRMSLKTHDVTTGAINSTCFNHDEQFFFTAGSDGLLNAHQFDKLAAVEEVKYDPLAAVEGAAFLPEDERKAAYAKELAKFQTAKPVVVPEANDDVALDNASMSITLKIKEEINKDVSGEEFSIQKSKLRTEEDHRQTLAEKKKNEERKKVRDLREEFEKIQGKNGAAEKHLRLTEDELNIDPEFFLILQERIDGKVTETKREERWDMEKHALALDKLNKKYYDDLEVPKFTVKAIRRKAHVTTFRVRAMAEFLTSNLEAFKQMLDSETVGKGDEDAEGPDDEDTKDNENAVDLEKQKEKEKQNALLAK